MNGPLVEELTPCPDCLEALGAFSDQPGLLFLHSALVRGPIGRYSFLSADPFETVIRPACEFGSDPFGGLRQALARFSSEPISGLPPFTGGLAGLLGYELGGAFERLPSPRFDDFALPQLAVGFYDWAIAWDHQQQRAWAISHGFPETASARREQRAARRLKFIHSRLKSASAHAAREVPFTKWTDSVRPRVPQFPAAGLEDLTSDFSRDAYLKAVRQIIDYIHAGDIFQANLSQRLLCPRGLDPPVLARRLCEENPAPFAGYFSLDDWAVVSASPERFVCVRDQAVETRPIKGTRQRRPVPEADLFTRDELRESGKDQAENVMIVDLLRNDLSRVCAPGSIRVPQLCGVESYATVQHLVSEVRGTLEPGRDVWDLFRAVFPGGSITGAPKVRAMEIINELEPSARGPYCGSLVYVGFDGNADSNILIRTFVCRGGWVQCGVGGGIVADSDPPSEYEETLHKAAGMLRVLK